MIVSKLARRANCLLKETYEVSLKRFQYTTSHSSSLGPTDSKASIEIFRTSESNPSKHDASHIGRFYTIPEADISSIYETTTSTFPAQFRTQCKTFNECCIMVREPFVDIKNCIEAYPSALPTLRYILYGKEGAGKTMTLSHLLHYGFLKEYILVHLNWAPIFTRFGKEFQASTTRPGFYDHTTNSVVWLSHFKSQNNNLFNKLMLKTSKEYVWSSREKTEANSFLTDIIEHGISRPVHAAECIYALFQELKIISSSGKCKTMVIIDGVNAFYYTSLKLKDENKNLISPSNVTVYEAFRQLFKSDWTGGVVVCSVDKLAIHSDFRSSDMPRYLLKKEGWEDFDPFVPIHIDVYSSSEVQRTIDYYLERKWLAHPNASSDRARKELEFISARNPYTLMQLCSSR